MSAILSADDLNDFISPGVACIKPVETLPTDPVPAVVDPLNPYSVTQEDKQPATTNKTAQISLTDCLACSGCVTSAEAVLVSLQSHKEVLENLRIHSRGKNGKGKTFVALLSPQTVASLAAAFRVTKKEARWMVEWLLRDRIKGRIPSALGEVDHESNGGFELVIDTDVGRHIALVYGFEEVWEAIQKKYPDKGKEVDEIRLPLSHRRRQGEGKTLSTIEEDPSAAPTKTPVLTSACPGFICYAENTHPYLIPHLSRLKSPQAILGTMIKSLLPRLIALDTGLSEEGPESIYIVSIQPCFDKKLEGARGQLTSSAWLNDSPFPGVRDVDCVITTKEIISLAEECSIEFSSLPRHPLDPPFPSSEMAISRLLGLDNDRFVSQILPPAPISLRDFDEPNIIGTSGGYLHYILLRLQQEYPGSQITIQRGRNSDTTEYILSHSLSHSPTPSKQIITLSRSYGFRNIQNLVRKLKPAKPRNLPTYGKKQSITPARNPTGPLSSRLQSQTKRERETAAQYAYVEIMACPGGCTNGGGQIKFDDERILLSSHQQGTSGSSSVSTSSAATSTTANRDWLSKVDEAYWSSEEAEAVASRPVSQTQGETDQQSRPPSPPHLSPLSLYPDPKIIKNIVTRWSELSKTPIQKLVYTSFKKVEDEFNKDKKDDDQDEEQKEIKSARRVAELAIKEGSGW